MKLNAMEIPFVKPHKLRKTPIIITLLLIFTLILLTLIPLCYPLLGYPIYLLQNFSKPKIMESSDDEEKCGIFNGEWVPNPEAPYYRNTTCWAIHEHQNCMKYGRPDSDFMKWKWKPNGCELPIFNPFQFLEIVRGKSLAFVGDSVGRNHMQSLICLLSRVEYPVDVSYTSDEQFKRWRYPSYNFTIATFWSPYLVKAEEADKIGPTHTGLFNIYLDQPNEEWTAQIADFDYLIINAGHWFFRPSIYYENNQIVGCRYCLINNLTDLAMSYGYRKAFRTAFRAINGIRNYKGITFLRTFAPSHFEGGQWNKGGNCVRTRPFRRNETELEGVNLELYETQLEEFKVGKEQGQKRGLKFRLMDITKIMLLRGDGHPSKYGHRPNENVTLYNDCVHWCLPGPIDTWNDFLFHMLNMETQNTSSQHNLHASDRKMKFR